MLATRCGDRPSGGAIIFFASGMSCGGVIALARPGAGYQVRVNWLTGGVEVVPIKN
jgi:general secretion pathway protein H